MRSGVVLFDLTRVVEELVFNSLDAGATKVIVAVGVGTNYIKVTDDGCGITRDGLVLLGERYATSKFEQLAGMNTVPESFGFRGEALSSISDVSLLEVFTKAHGMPNGYRKGCKCLYLGIDGDRQEVGTTAYVILLLSKKLYYNLSSSCSGDELLSLYPSSSPLPLLKNGFGVEASSSLHKLDVSVGQLKLSGYICGPNETFSVKDWDSVFAFIKETISCFWSQGAHISEEDAIWNGADTSSTRNGNSTNSYPLNNGLPKKRCVTRRHQDSVVLSSPQMEMPREEPKQQHQDSFVLSSPQMEMPREEPKQRHQDSFVLSSPQMEMPREEPKQRHQDSFVLSSPQLEMPREEPKHMPFSSYSCRRTQRNVKSEDYGNELDFAFLPDNQLQMCTRSFPECESPTPHESGNLLGVPNSYTSLGDIYLNTKCSGEPSKEYMDHLLDAKWNPGSLHTVGSSENRLVVKELAAVPFHFDSDGQNIHDGSMKPFLRRCFSHKDVPAVVASTRSDDLFRSQDDGFKKWLYMDDRFDFKKADHRMKGSEPWLNAATVWSPLRITTSSNLGTYSPLLLKGSFDSILAGKVCLTEDKGYWASPVASIRGSKSSRRSLNCDLFDSKVGFAFGEKMHAEPLTDVSKRHFKHRIDDEFDLSAYNEGETDIFNIDEMKYSSSWKDCSWLNHMDSSSPLKDHVSCKKNIRNSGNDSILFPQRCDFKYETEWKHSESFDKDETCIPVAASHHMSSISYADVEKSKIGHCRFQDKQRRRSCSAPPFYRGKKKFVALNSCMTDNSDKSHDEKLHAPTLQEASNASHQKHIKKLSPRDHLVPEVTSVRDLQSKARPDQKKVIDKAEITDSETEAAHCLDSIQKPDDLTNQDNVLDLSSGILHLSGDSLLPKSISKKCLAECRVLQQVDRKFIPVVGGGILAVIDQHAADERIRLEDLREKVLSGETKTTYLDAEQELVLPEIGYQLLNNYSEQIQKWGWICNFHAKSSVSFKKNLNFLHNQPSVATLIAVPCILGVNLTDADLLEFLQQLADTDGSSLIPPAVLRVLNSKACRGAIMFGDALLLSECSLIVEELKQTSMCFQCAHGRPTTAPLVNLVELHKQIVKLENRSHASSGPWHGLTRHVPSLERAAQRLSSGGG
ncbi:DNA mismatch repair protein family [Artemisia annua]|uniref:DNA mismatch repair protein family n=1 Tax=Artemisia annua TaxID=35608 RepID=A0A2U1QAT0_ARTAN|nr:DNA mismatch repair protein family [Artemisia annua]